MKDRIAGRPPPPRAAASRRWPSSPRSVRDGAASRRSRTSERAALAARFRFTAFRLPELPGPPTAHRAARAPQPCAPSTAWISSVGAGVALDDLDGDGLPNDLCHVDPRTDRVIVAPVPGTGARYAPFALDAAPLPVRARPPWRRWAACPATSTRTAGWTCSSTTGAAPRSRSCAARTARCSAGRLRAGGGRGRAASAGTPTRRPSPTWTATGTPTWSSATTSPTARASWTPAADGQRARCRTRCRAPSTAGATASCSGQGDAGPAVGALREAEGVFDGRGRPRLDPRGRRRGPRRRPAARAVLRQRLRARPPAAQPLDARARPASPCWRAAGTSRTPSSKVLGHDSFKGMGVDFARPERRRAARHLRQQHRRRVRAGGEPLRLGEHGPARPQMRTGVAPYVDRSEPLGLSRSGWGWDRGWPTSTTTACSRRCRPSASCGDGRTAGRSCRSWPWATTSSCRDAGSLAPLPSRATT